MRWVTKAFVQGRLFKSMLLISLMHGFLCALSLHAEPVKVVVLLPFSGVFKDLGADAKNGFLLGLKKEATEAKVNLESGARFKYLSKSNLVF